MLLYRLWPDAFGKDAASEVLCCFEWSSVRALLLLLMKKLAGRLSAIKAACAGDPANGK